MSERWNGDPDRKWEEYVHSTAQAFEYPPTPDILAAAQPEAPSRLHVVTVRRLAQIAAILLIVLAALFAVPEIRAGILEFIRVGVITVFFGGEPTPTAIPSAAPTATEAGQTPAPTRRPTATPRPSPTPLASVLDLPGETTLEAARSEAGFDILLPTYPEDLGEPDRVLLQNMGGNIVTLVWFEPGSETDIRLVIQILDEHVVASKYQISRDFVATRVNGARADWLYQPHKLEFYGPGGGYERTVTGNVLMWTKGRLTYRLEADIPMEEAVRIAESVGS